MATREVAQRRDPDRVPGSRHFATVLAFGDFVFPEGPTIRCEGIPGISGVVTSPEVRTLRTGQPQVSLTRILTHFQFDSPPVLIEQHYSKPSVGTLTGLRKGKSARLLPGRASFSQHIILILDGQALANREPLVMTAERLEEWPPLDAEFKSEKPTNFFALEELEKPRAKIVATLTACNVNLVEHLAMPSI